MHATEIRFDTTAPKLLDFLESDKANQFIMGPLGSGKTNAAIFKAFALICQQRPNAEGVRRSRWVVSRNTYSDLETTTIPDWRAIVGDALGEFSHTHPPEHRLRFKLPDGPRVESDVYFIALDREEHVRKLRGMQLTGALLNEAKEQPKGIFDMMTLRVGRFPPKNQEGCSWSGVIGDYNAPDEDHWLFELHAAWMRGELPDYEFFIQPGGVIGQPGAWKVNPDAENLDNLPDGYYQKGMQGKANDWIAVNLANRYGFVRDGKVIFPEYVDALHCKPFEMVKGLSLRLGADFGLTPALVIAQRLINGRWLIHDEIVTEELGAKNFARLCVRELALKYPDYEIEAATGDPAGDQRLADDEEKTVFKVMGAEGFHMKPAHTNDFTVRTSAVSGLLSQLIDGEPGLLIHPRCKVLRKAFGGRYCYKRMQVAGEARYHLKPDKNKWSHVAEAAQYLVLGGGEGKKVVRATPQRVGAIRVISQDSVFD